MNAHEFLNVCKKLHNVDRYLFDKADIKMDDFEWGLFRNDPITFLFIITDERAAAILKLVGIE